MRALLLLLAFLAFGGSPSEASAPDGLAAFRVFVPESPLTQGDRIQVKYILDATHYSIRGFDGGMEGAILEDLDVQKEESGDPQLHRVVVSAIFRIASCGELLVRPMSAMIGDERVRSDSVCVTVEPHPQYGQEWEIARDFLCSHEVPAEGMTLEYKYGTRTLCAFSDPLNKTFAVVVRRDYQPYMANPVLAYGIGNPMWSGEDEGGDNSVYYILSRYESQLQTLRQRRETYRTLRPSSYTPDPAGVKPLLGDIAFAQTHPYNALFPTEKVAGRDSSCLAGCGPVALAQILAYHRHSAAPRGSCLFSTKGGKTLRLRLEDHPFRWGGSDQDLAEMMLDCAASVGAVMGPSATSSSLVDFKPALIDNWGYSPLCTLVDNYFDFNMLAMLYQELDEGRPVIAADDNHLFVIDGYEQDFFHLNLGWEGYCNGYYRAIVIPSVTDHQLPFKQLLTGIRPLPESEALALSIRTRQPGTLASLLTPEQQRKVTKLTLSGPINGEDIELLRTMAGAVYRLGDYERGHGSLMELDLSRAIIEGGQPHTYRKADGMVISGTAYQGHRRIDYRYDLSNLSDADWKRIQELGIDRNDSMWLGKSDGGQLYVAFLAKDDTVTSHMFDGCSNLRTLYLPKKVKSIEKEAIFDCRALEHVYRLPRKKAESAIRYCPRLQEQ